MRIQEMMCMYFRMAFIDSMENGKKEVLEIWGIDRLSIWALEKEGNLYQIMKVTRVNQLRTAILSDSIRGIGQIQDC